MNEYKKKENELWLDTHDLSIEDFPAEGYILDICGGGEGVIGQLKGEQVISIDRSRRELEEAKSQNLKIIMDATNLQFLDNSFNTAAIFFGFMYMNKESRIKTFEEVKRVLKPQGRFLIWALTIPELKEKNKEVIIIPVRVILPDREFETGYGVPIRPQNKQFFIEIAEKLDFKLLSEKVTGETFYLEFEKK